MFPTILPTLSAPNLFLRPLGEADIPAWFARATDVESALLAGDPVPASIAEGAAWLARHRERFQAKTALRWAIVVPGIAESVGTIGLILPAPGARTASLGFVLGRGYWGQGFGSAAARLVTGYALETLGFTALEAEALRRNAASRRILEKLGFRHLRALPPDPHDQEEADLYALLNPAHSRSSSP